MSGLILPLHTCTIGPLYIVHFWAEIFGRQLKAVVLDCTETHPQKAHLEPEILKDSLCQEFGTKIPLNININIEVTLQICPFFPG